MLRNYRLGRGNPGSGLHNPVSGVVMGYNGGVVPVPGYGGERESTSNAREHGSFYALQTQILRTGNKLQYTFIGESEYFINGTIERVLDYICVKMKLCMYPCILYT